MPLTPEKIKASYEKFAADPEAYLKKETTLKRWVVGAALVVGFVLGALLI